MSTDNYSQNAKYALRMGHYLARQMHHPQVDTDHLFVGILQTPNSVGCQVLSAWVDTQEALRVIEHLHSTKPHLDDKLPFSDALRSALTYAIAEARWLNHDYIGTEHFVLGLLRSGEGQLVALLRAFELKPDQIRGKVKRLVQDGIREITLEEARRMATLSELGRRVLNAAEDLARQYNHQGLTPHHLLWALAHERRGVGYRVLPQCGLDVEGLSEDVAQLPAYVAGGQAMVNHLVEGAVQRAEILGTHYTGTEHLLLAMTVDNYGQRLLMNYDVDLNCLHQRLKALLL
jgi:ATP-dependent Clp protease ATP-binding subunit ClpA